MKTFTLKQNQIEKKWHVIDADGLVLGRLASYVANILRGKHKPTYTPHMDCGDYVVIVNADKIALTGNKLEDKVFYWHTGYFGGVKSRTMKEILTGKYPERVLLKAVQRMIPKGPLGREQLRHLYAYCGAEHPHGAQKPEVIDFGSMNSKNKKA